MIFDFEPWQLDIDIGHLNLLNVVGAAGTERDEQVRIKHRFLSTWSALAEPEAKAAWYSSSSFAIKNPSDNHGIGKEPR